MLSTCVIHGSCDARTIATTASRRLQGRRRAADLGRLEPRALLVPLEVVRQRLVVALDAPEGREEGAHLGRLADADRINNILEERLRRAPLEDGQRVRRRVVRRDALAGLVQFRPVELRRVQDRGLVDAHIFEELLVHVVVLADGRERHVARRRDLVLDDAQPVFPDELAEGPLDVEVRVEDAVRQGPLEALAVELRVVLHDLRDDGRAVVASNIIGGLRELARDGLRPQRDVRVLGAGVRRI